MVFSERILDVVIPCSEKLEELKYTLNSLIPNINYINKLIIVFSGENKQKYEELANKKLFNSIFEDHLFFLKDERSITTPGSARNVGLRNCEAKFVGFIDCGMHCNSEWVDSFLRTNSFIRIGSTNYYPMQGFQTISALVTYGTKASINSLPGTIIELSKCQTFNEKYRIGEDLIWKLYYKDYWNSSPQYPCIYSYFPENFRSLFIKFYLLNIHALKVGGSQFKKVIFYSISSFLIYLAACLGFINNLNLITFIFTFIYLIIRFCIKNKYKFLFSLYIFIAIPLQLLFDVYRWIIVMRFFLKYFI